MLRLIEKLIKNLLYSCFEYFRIFLLRILVQYCC